MPRCVLAICCLQHKVACFRIIVPAPIRFEIHRAQLPWPDRIMYARQKAPFLFILSDLEPGLDQNDPGVGDPFFDQGAKIEEPLMFRVGAESHDEFNAGSIVPAAIENDDLASGRELLNMSLNEELGLFAFGGCRQCDDPKDARAYPFGDGLNRTALAGGIAPLEQNDDAQAFV